jgi:hypothetical protein
MTGRPLLWSPAHVVVIDHDGSASHRLWCPDVRDDDGTAGTHVTPENALMEDLRLLRFGGARNAAKNRRENVSICRRENRSYSASTTLSYSPSTDDGGHLPRRRCS